MRRILTWTSAFTGSVRRQKSIFLYGSFDRLMIHQIKDGGARLNWGA
ncbi:hypothetical protein [Halobacillus ihumii]|nr:hypothetical protein [Halobacillus ihumii]